jgi:RimJ/RimL family protein N-acetyltransferase
LWRIIGNQRERGVTWAKDRFPHIQEGEDWSKASALILERAGNITAVVLYNNFWPGNSVEASIALERGSRLNRAFLRAMFQAPFLEWGLRRVTLKIASDNAKSIRFAEHLGFKREGLIREGVAKDTDLILMGMLRNECRFLDEQGIATSRP